eukprot:m.133346 g.133346  ORF g.133346 m.133346 type:complete len:114 (+) comp17538_c0_seq1:1518-1859(+)
MSKGVTFAERASAIKLSRDSGVGLSHLFPFVMNDSGYKFVRQPCAPILFNAATCWIVRLLTTPLVPTFPPPTFFGLKAGKAAVVATTHISDNETNMIAASGIRKNKARNLQDQ